MPEIKIKKDCPMCGKTNSLNLSSNEFSNYQKYLNREGLVQELLPDLNIFEREFLMTNICLKCQEKLFGRKSVIRKERWN